MRKGLYPLNKISKQRSSLSMLEVFGTRGKEPIRLPEPTSALIDAGSTAGENSTPASFLPLPCLAAECFLCFFDETSESLADFVLDGRLSDVLAAASTFTSSSGCELDDEYLT